MTNLEAEKPDLLVRLERDVAREESSGRAAAAADDIGALLSAEYQVGDLIRMDFGEAHVLVHDALRQQVGGVPHGCLLLAARAQVSDEGSANASGDMPSLLLLRVLGSSALPNDIEMQQARFQAGQRASDSSDNWDENQNTDQFTLHQMRYAGLRCSILGTFRMVLDDESGKWRLTFGSDIDNFYAGQGMKVYKPVGEALERIVNFTTDAASESGRVRIGEIKYAAGAGCRPPRVSASTDDDAGCGRAADCSLRHDPHWEVEHRQNARPCGLRVAAEGYDPRAHRAVNHRSER